MRQLLVDQARKRGGHSLIPGARRGEALRKKRERNLIALDDALTCLGELDARQGQIVELRFFGGLSIEDIAHVLGVSTATLKREWATTRLWLHKAMSRSAEI
jgi:RNA polymerase sigma-70 factor, ECF subfamily